METLLFHQPFKMIVVSMTAVSILIAGLLIYRYIYPKKKINLLVLLLLISTLPLISILRPGSYQSGDLTLHAKYAMQFFDNIAQGNIIPQWIGNHCSSYGCPEYIYIFFLPYYLISFFHFIGFSFIDSVKVLLIVSFYTSGIGMYLWMKDELGKKAGFVAAIFYLFAPYHLIDLSFRVSIGELTSLAILPFLFLTTKKLVTTRKNIFILLTSLSLALLILSHQATALISFPIVILYGIIVWLRKKEKTLHTVLVTLSSYLLGILLSAFYWIPIFALKNDIWYGAYPKIDFHTFLDTLYSPHRFGILFQGHMGELYINVGYTEWLVLFFALYLLYKKRVKGNDKKLLLFALGMFLILFIFTQSITKPIWNYFSFTESIQFAWRLFLEMSLIVAVVAGVIAKNVKSNKFIFILCAITIMYTILNWGNRQTEPQLTDAIFRNQPLFQEKPGEVELTTPVWVDRYAKWIGIYPKSHMQVLSGSAQITPEVRQQTLHTYKISVKKNAVIKENTFYFPGWELFVNGQQKPINYLNKKYRGVITFPLKKGTYQIKLLYVYNSVSVIAQRLSLFA